MNNKFSYNDREILNEEEELKYIYLSLKEMSARLIEIEQKYPHAQNFKSVIDKAIAELEDASHLIDSEVQAVKDLRNKKRKLSENMYITEKRGEQNG
ncbi:MAG: hypothetical protein ACQEQC_04350 [Elusimicrobiota bacterium]